MHYCFLTGLYKRDDVLMFTRQGKALVAAGHKVSYIVCDSGPNEIVNDINIVSTGFIPKNRLNRYFKTTQIVLKEAIKINADIYQVSDPEMLGIVSKLKHYGKKVVFNLREFYPDIIKTKPFLPPIIAKIVSKYFDLKLKYYLKKYDAVITVTDWILEEIIKRYELNNAYCITNFPIVDNSFSLSLVEYMKRDNVLFYEGTIYKTSRQENVFSALERIPSMKYFMAGVIEEGCEYIINLPYWEKVIFKNGFTQNELPELLSKATIANVFRDFEGRDGSYGVLKVFECMAAGLPVLFTDVPLYRSIVEKYHCGLCVDPNNSDSIYKALLYLLNNKEEAYVMGQNGRRAVEVEYNWEKQSEIYLSIIRNLL